MRTKLHVIILSGWLLLGGCASTRPVAYGVGAPAQLFDGMGTYSLPISTNSAEAQRYFDQGLNWAYAFNHDEAVRSFTRAAELDPDCAMAWWGVAWCQGPNYNDPEMPDVRSQAAWNALRKALARLDGATQAERVLIEALSHRYAKPWPGDRTDLEQAYADAMAKVWQDYPTDPDVGTLYAEALMILHPWKLYTREQQPIEGTDRIVAVLEQVLAMAPNHPGANHLYIHAVEPSATPERGIAAANRLRDLVPAAGHLDHMPSHIYVQVGMWDEAVVQNQKAMAADEKYRALSPEQRIQHMYMVHNAHMLAFAGMMSGREREALAAARSMWEEIPADALPASAPFVDKWMCAVYDVEKRFGRWDAILAEPPPPEFMPITTASWHAARAIAYAAKKEFDAAEREYEAFRQATAAIPADAMWGPDLAHTALQAGDHFIGAEIALQQGDLATAVVELEKGAAVEDSLSYGEPPKWLQPIRHTLGAVLLTMGEYAEAERVYTEDLDKWPNNGWSLYGLSRALDGQGETSRASAARARYETAWKHADAPTETSCKCIPKT